MIVRPQRPQDFSLCCTAKTATQVFLPVQRLVDRTAPGKPPYRPVSERVRQVVHQGKARAVRIHWKIPVRSLVDEKHSARAQRRPHVRHKLDPFFGQEMFEHRAEDNVVEGSDIFGQTSAAGRGFKSNVFQALIGIRYREVRAPARRMTIQSRNPGRAAACRRIFLAKRSRIPIETAPSEWRCCRHRGRLHRTTTRNLTYPKPPTIARRDRLYRLRGAECRDVGRWDATQLSAFVCDLKRDRTRDLARAERRSRLRDSESRKAFPRS
jgi:hypothetical protein